MAEQDKIDTADQAANSDGAPLKAEAPKRNIIKQCSDGIAWAYGLFEPLRKTIVNLGIIGGVIFGAPALYKIVIKAPFVIKDIAVPGSLSDRGFTGDVLAQQILDRISDIDAEAGSKKVKADISGFDLESTMPSITLPVGGFNIGSIISELRTLFGIHETKVTGEVYVAATDDKGPLYGIRLRINGVGPIMRTEKGTADIQSLIDAAAQTVMRRYDPINLGYYFYRKKDFKRAYEMTEQALADPSPDNDPWAYTMRGLIARDEGRFDDAASAMKEAINRSPTFWMGYVNLAGLLRLDGKLDEAEAAARKAVDLAPKEQESHSALALVLMDQGKKDEALSEMKKGVDADPKDPSGHLEFGRLLARLEKYQDALSAFETSAALNPNSEPLLQAADVSKNLKNDSAVLSYVRQATDAEPQNARAWLALGETLLARGQFPKAAQAFDKAIEVDDAPPSALVRAANSYAAQKRLADAEALFVKNAKGFDKNQDFQIGWSEVLWIEGKKADAAAKLKQVIEDGESPPKVFESGGRILEARSEIAEAIAAYQKAMGLDPRMQDVLRPHIEQLAARLPARPAPVSAP